MIKDPVARAEYERNHQNHLNRARAYYQANRETILEKEKARREQHPEIARERLRSWRSRNKKRATETSKDYYLRNREVIIAKQKARYWSDPQESRRRQRITTNKYRSIPENRERINRQEREWRRANPEISRARWVKYKYGLTKQQYDNMLASQNGVCAICKGTNQHPTRWKNVSDNLTIDHCHSTGRIRGLLCHKCNAGMGLFGDSIEKLLAAVGYLKHHS